MPSNIVVEATNKAKTLRMTCKLTPSKRVYLPLTAVLVKICRVATPESRREAAELLMFAVKMTESLLENGVDPQLPSQFPEGLVKFESALVAIHRHIESIPNTSTKARKLSALAFRIKSPRLRAELIRTHKTLMKNSGKLNSFAPRGECILEVASVGIRLAGAVVELPVVNLLKPLVVIAASICETAKVVNGNREAAIALAAHVQNVTDSVVERATAGDENSLAVLRRVLDQIQKSLDVLKCRRGGVVSFVLARKDKERFTTLHLALDRALQVFTSSQTVKTIEIVHANTEELAMVKATVTSVERIVTLADLDRLRSAHDTAFVPVLPINVKRSFFFIDLSPPHNDARPVD
ncbi:hypothetical protein B0H16DRAFT_1697516 [Mycena metata]|uniref:Uncharacterized protein n=1 Tax=Mycena metata TaxID=1033252 RepID=A0AAD7MR50_9AGAR|nr:hypothetical protein B0H16DRAFT_1697516 [Mycena metata]